ncbi:hypothetical protein [Leptolyngbya sp. Heron Island J]|uniref:ribonuclease toxin HepT-like protein n=1 Tax=Leptolyngbya sp. Heron Island J TaxID=1385935 RepID=UPI0004CF7378|nr:hypothetical protein [Leptolyngbya sp. Heron Island J]
MERERLAGLTAEINGQWRLIERVSNRLQARVDEGLDTPGQLDSIAYQIHNLYCSIEDLLKLIANAFENRIGTSSEWHRVLLLRLSQPVEGIRPAFLSEEAFDALNKLRSFRHMFRHAYGTEIELSQLQPNIDTALQASRSVKQDIGQFLEKLTKLAE